jgi:hypothetical protein
MNDDKLREFMLVLRQALLMIVAHIERMYDLKPKPKTGA